MAGSDSRCGGSGKRVTHTRACSGCSRGRSCPGRASSRTPRPTPSRRSRVSRSARKIGLKSVSPKPGPRRFGSLAWKWAVCAAFARITSGVGVASADIAFTSRCSWTFGWPSRRISSTASAAVFMKFVSAGVERFQAEVHAGLLQGGQAVAERVEGVVVGLLRGSRRRGCSAGAASRGPGCRRPGRRQRGPGPRGTRRSARRTAASAEVRWKPSVFASSQCRPMIVHAGGLGLPAQLGPAGGGHVGDARGEGERGDLQPGVAEFGDAAADAGVVPALERLVADGVLHATSRHGQGERSSAPRDGSVGLTTAQSRRDPLGPGGLAVELGRGRRPACRSPWVISHRFGASPSALNCGLGRRLLGSSSRTSTPGGATADCWPAAAAFCSCWRSRMLRVVDPQPVDRTRRSARERDVAGGVQELGERDRRRPRLPVAAAVTFSVTFVPARAAPMCRNRSSGSPTGMPSMRLDRVARTAVGPATAGGAGVDAADEQPRAAGGLTDDRAAGHAEEAVLDLPPGLAAPRRSGGSSASIGMAYPPPVSLPVTAAIGVVRPISSPSRFSSAPPLHPSVQPGVGLEQRAVLVAGAAVRWSSRTRARARAGGRCSGCPTTRSGCPSANAGRERVAERDDPHPAERRSASPRCRLVVRRTSASRIAFSPAGGVDQRQHGQVAAGVGRVDVGVGALAAGQADVDLGRALDQVVVGQDQAVAGVRVDDDARCRTGCRGCCSASARSSAVGGVDRRNRPKRGSGPVGCSRRARRGRRLGVRQPRVRRGCARRRRATTDGSAASISFRMCSWIAPGRVGRRRRPRPAEPASDQRQRAGTSESRRRIELPA